MPRILFSLTMAALLFLLHGCAGDAAPESAPTDAESAPAADTDPGATDLGAPGSPEAMDAGSATSDAPPEQSEPELSTPDESGDTAAPSASDGPILPEPGN